MKIAIWGSRGSLPSLGPGTRRYGGNTACVEVLGDDGTLLVLDAGTGIKNLGESLGPEVSRVDILLTHLHIDHILGLLYFAPLNRSDTEAHIWGPPMLTTDLQSGLDRHVSPPLFPIHIRELACHLTTYDTPRGTFHIGGLEVASDLICHPWPTVGYRITEGGRSVAYLPDHEPALGARHFPEDPDWVSGFELVSGADILIHDAQYSAAEYASSIGYGHSSIPQALALSEAAHVGTLVPFHHDPNHSDDLLDELLGEARQAAGNTFDMASGAEGAIYRL